MLQDEVCNSKFPDKRSSPCAVCRQLPQCHCDQKNAQSCITCRHDSHLLHLDMQFLLPTATPLAASRYSPPDSLLWLIVIIVLGLALAALLLVVCLLHLHTGCAQIRAIQHAHPPGRGLRQMYHRRPHVKGPASQAPTGSLRCMSCMGAGTCAAINKLSLKACQIAVRIVLAVSCVQGQAAGNTLSLVVPLHPAQCPYLQVGNTAGLTDTLDHEHDVLLGAGCCSIFCPVSASIFWNSSTSYLAQVQQVMMTHCSKCSVRQCRCHAISVDQSRPTASWLFGREQQSMQYGC